MISRRRFLAASAAAALLPSTARADGTPMPIFDAHVHFSHDAAERFSAVEAVAILGERGAQAGAGVELGRRWNPRAPRRRAGPGSTEPSPPTAGRGEIGSWVDDPSVIDFLEDRLNRFKWVAVRRVPQ